MKRLIDADSLKIKLFKVEIEKKRSLSGTEVYNVIDNQPTIGHNINQIVSDGYSIGGRMERKEAIEILETWNSCPVKYCEGNCNAEMEEECKLRHGHEICWSRRKVRDAMNFVLSCSG